MEQSYILIFRKFLKRLWLDYPELPFYYLGDYDIYGIEILFNYSFGSELTVFERDNLPNINWIGL